MSYLNIEQLMRFDLFGKGENRTAPFDLVGLTAPTTHMYDLLEDFNAVSFVDLRRCLSYWEGGELTNSENGKNPHEMFLRKPLIVGSLSSIVPEGLATRFSRGIEFLMDPNITFNPDATANRDLHANNYNLALVMRSKYDYANQDKGSLGILLPDNISYSGGEHARVKFNVKDEIFIAGLWVPPSFESLQVATRTDQFGNKTEPHIAFGLNVRAPCSSHIYTYADYIPMRLVEH